jgi:hypothetical protein
LEDAVRADPEPLHAVLARALEGHPRTVFVVHGTWVVGADGPMVLPGDLAVIRELERLGYRGSGADWEVGVTEYRRP